MNRDVQDVSVESTDGNRIRPSMDEWVDVSENFKNACEDMSMGEMIHTQTFSLYTAMSAIELMDPKMDIGCRIKRNSSNIRLPKTLSDSQTVSIMDHLLACEMSWLDGHTLPQTVFSCIYSQKLHEIPRDDLFSFVRLQLASMGSIFNLVLTEKIAEEEEFVSCTFSFQFHSMARNEDNDDKFLERILANIHQRVQAVQGEESEQLLRAIELRMNFRVLFYKLIRNLTGSSVHDSLPTASKLLGELISLASKWHSCPFRKNEDKPLIDQLFDPFINRHVLTSAPPRSASLMEKPAAFNYLVKVLHELEAVLSLHRVALAPDSNAVDSSRKHSLHVAIQALEMFWLETAPCVLSRSILSRIMIPPSVTYLFGKQGSSLDDLIRADLGYNEAQVGSACWKEPEQLVESVAGIFECFCRNRSRQRRQLLGVLRWWDHYVTSTRKIVATANQDSADQTTPIREESDETEEDSTSDDPLARLQYLQTTIRCKSKGPFYGMTPLEIVCFEVCCRLMIQHWLIGFECDLYQEFEYVAVFFYVGYVLTSLENATTALTGFEVDVPQPHPLRVALHVLDQARSWLSRALFWLLQAMSEGEQWSYTANRSRAFTRDGKSTTFGDESLWYEQRFGVVMGIASGPAYADYNSFRSYTKSHEDMLLKESVDETDLIKLKLREAADALLVARRKLDQARQLALQSTPNALSEEILRLGRVVVENSLVVTRLLKSYKPSSSTTASESLISKVSFEFTRHKHFPVVVVNE